MRAVLRRTPADDRVRSSDGNHPDVRPVLDAGGIRIDPDRHQVSVRDVDVHLRRKEFELLSLLIENSGRVLTRDVLIDRIWGSDYYGDTKTLDVHIKRLRNHVEKDPSSPTLITTIRGVGYRFNPSAD
jgi:two-component system response regulator RegX3